MNRKHITGISVLIALAVVAGLVAVVRTAGIVAGDASATDSLVSARTAQLDQAETGLRSEIARLNARVAVPAAGSGAAGGTAAGAAAGVPSAEESERVVYVRPAPIVRSASGDDHGSDDHGSDDGGSHGEGDDD